MKLRFLFPALAGVLSACSGDFDILAKRSSTRTEGLAPPSNLAGESRGGGSQIVLRWSDNSTNETGFRVEIAKKPMASVEDVEEWTIVGADATSHVHPSRPGFRYYVRVYAVTETRQSAPSEQIDVATAFNPPAAPTGLSAEGDSPFSIRLQWDDVGEESGYVIERADGPGGPWAVVADGAPADGTTYVDHGLPSNTTFWYRVAATNAIGTSGYSNEVDGWTLAAGTWSSSYDTSEDDGYHTSIAMDGFNPYIAYYETTFSRTMVRGPGPLRKIDDAAGAVGTSTAVSGGVAHVATIVPNQLRRFSGTSGGGFSVTNVNTANGWIARPKLIAGTSSLEYVAVSATSGASLLYWSEGK
ncbi:MAG TPA: fibronectin type III domain-containing protein, partial [Planctomycetota bacterium]|nr:fibronectin type III domain-containing protein [Planctomycetota bacterium]